MKGLKVVAAAAAVCMSLSACAFGDNDSSVQTYVEHNDTPQSSSSQITEEYGDSSLHDTMYDVSPIIEAYHSGDTSKLSELDLEIYNEACRVLDMLITEGMDDYEKELAVHDYIIANCTYDQGSLSAIPNPSEHCEDPYGALINGQAICKGYTTTFRMFMGMLGISCGTVYASDTEGDEHAWNTVLLDGSWYYVDCTWDDPVPDYDGRLVTHTYFNITREQILQDHVLPEGSPDTDSLENTFYSRSASRVESFEEIYSLALAAAQSNHDGFTVIFSEQCGMNLDMVSANEAGYFTVDNQEFYSTLDSLRDRFSAAGYSYAVADHYLVETSQGRGVYIKISVT